MVLQMKLEAVNFRKDQEISLLFLDCFITKFREKLRGSLSISPGPNRVNHVSGFIQSLLYLYEFLFLLRKDVLKIFLFECRFFDFMKKIRFLLSFILTVIQIQERHFRPSKFKI